MDFHYDDETGKIVLHDNFDGHLGRKILKGLRKGGDEILQTEISSGSQDTFLDVLSKTIRLAKSMRSRGLKIGDTIMVSAVNHNNTSIPLYACQYYGIIPYHLVVGMTYDEIKHLTDLGNPKLIFSDPECADIIKQVIDDLKVEIEIIVFGEYKTFTKFSDLLLQPIDNYDDFECDDFDPENTVAMLVGSSGSTGPPKLVALTHKAVILNFTNFERPPIKDLAFITFSPLYWISGIGFTISSVIRNFNKIWCSKPFSVELFKLAVQKYKPFVAFISSLQINSIINEPNIEQFDLSSIGVVYSGGSFISHDTAKKFQSLLKCGLFFVTYAATETGFMTLHKGYENDSLGKMHPWIDWKVVDLDTEKRLGPNELGELHVKTPTMFQKYFNQPEATALAFDKEGYYKTGDLVYYNDEGLIYLVDRIKEMYKYCGYQISTAEIERVIDSMPGVTASAVVGLPHDVFGEIPMAFVQLNQDSDVTVDMIKDHVKSIQYTINKLSDAKHLRGGVVIVDQIPLTYTGKIDRKQLRTLKYTIKKKFNYKSAL